MRETAAELKALQALIDRSHDRLGPHMKGITHPDKYALSAKQVVKLCEGMKTVAVAAPSPKGEPLVAPMDGWFLHGKWFFSSSGDSIRIKGLRKLPRARWGRSTGSSRGITAGARSIGAPRVSTCVSMPTASSPIHGRRRSSPPRAGSAPRRSVGAVRVRRDTRRRCTAPRCRHRRG